MPDEPLGDAELLTRFASQGDREALGLLFERHAGFAFRAALAVLGERGAAEDVVQEAFLKVIAAARSFRRDRPFRPWLKVLVVRTALNRHRGEGRRALHEAARLPSSRQEDALMQEERRETVERLRRELALLPDEERLPLVLHYQAGCSYEEVAQSLGWPSGTVATRISSGKERLRSRLATAGVLLAAGGSLEEVLAAGAPEAMVSEGLSRTLSELAGSAVAPRPGTGVPTRTAWMGASAALLLLGIYGVIRAGHNDNSALVVPGSAVAQTGLSAAHPLSVPPAAPEGIPGSDTSDLAGMVTASSSENTAVVFGQVTCQETGKPIAGIGVRLRSRLEVSVYSDGWHLMEGDETVKADGLTDAEGRFRIEVPTTLGRYVLVAGVWGVFGTGEHPSWPDEGARGFIPYESWRIPFVVVKRRFSSMDQVPEADRATVSFPALVPGEERRQDLRLSRGVGFRLSVKDSGGNPVEGAYGLACRLSAPGEGPHDGVWNIDLKGGIFDSVAMDPSELAAPDLWTLTLERVGGGWSRELPVRSSPTVEGRKVIEFTLDPLSEVEGKVLGPDGSIWKGKGHVLCWPVGMEREAAREKHLLCRIPIGKDGAFALKELTRSDAGYWLQAWSPWNAMPEVPVCVPPGGKTDLRLKAGEADWKLTGRVLDAQGRPAAHAHVLAWFRDNTQVNPHSAGDGEDCTTETDEEGRFSFPGVRRVEGLCVVAYTPNDANPTTMDWTDPLSPVLVDAMMDGPRYPPSGWRGVPAGTPHLEIRLDSGVQPFR